MGISPIKQTLDGMILKLKDVIQTRDEADKQVTEYTNAIKALAKVVEDREVGDSYLVALDELSGKPSFMAAIRSILRLQVGAKKGFTPTEVKALIVIGKKMDLSSYSNPMASIHTTLRRMKDSGEIEEFTNDKGEKAFRMVSHSGLTNPPIPPRRIKAFPS